MLGKVLHIVPLLSHVFEYDETVKIKKLNDNIKNFFVTELLNIAAND